MLLAAASAPHMVNFSPYMVQPLRLAQTIYAERLALDASIALANRRGSLRALGLRRAI
jgi:hypothetical protein